MGELAEWRKQDWVRIDSSGNIVGECGTSKDKKNPDRCLPRSKANSLSNGGAMLKNHRGCGAVMSERRKRTRYTQEK